MMIVYSGGDVNKMSCFFANVIKIKFPNDFIPLSNKSWVYNVHNSRKDFHWFSGADVGWLMVDGQTLEMGARRTSTFWPAAAAAAGNTVCRVRWSTVPVVVVVGASGRRVVPVGRPTSGCPGWA